MARYTILAADLRTNAILAELPLTQASFVTRLNDVGDLRGSILLTDPTANVVANYLQSATQPSRTAVYVDRDGALVWGGILWTGRYTASTGMLDLQGQDFLSYFAHRLLLVDKTYTNQDQIAIFTDLFNYAKGLIGGDIGLVLGGSASSAVLRTLAYNAYDLKVLGDAFRELSAMDQGFDYAVDLSYVAGVPTKTLNLSYPRRGAVAGVSGWLFEFEAAGWYHTAAGASAPLISGNVYDYTWPVDGTLQAVAVYDTGAGSGRTMLQASFSTPALIDAGYPLLESTFGYKDVTDPQRLAALAKADGKALANPIALPQLFVRADLDPVLGSYTIGDDCRVRILDHRFNSGVDAVNNPVGPGLDAFYRIIEIDVKAGFDQPEEVILTLGPSPQ